MKLEGTITDGLGTAKFFVNKINEVFKKRTGITLFPGTLNIKLNEPYLVKPDFIIRKEEFNATENVLVQKCKILDKDVYIVRAEKNQKGTGEHNLEIIEIVSNINLRKTYKLENNQKIIVDVEN